MRWECHSPRPPNDRNQGRKPATQVWAVGEQVKVGFLSLRITAKTGFGWLLTNKDATKHYEFAPHHGLVAL